MIKGELWSNQQGEVYNFDDKRLLRDVGFWVSFGLQN
jgi:hypothetical protein